MKWSTVIIMIDNKNNNPCFHSNFGIGSYNLYLFCISHWCIPPWLIRKAIFCWIYNNNNGNFICVFEFTIVNLATYRQFTNATWDWIIKKKPTNKQQKQNKTKSKIIIIIIIIINQNCVKSGLSQFLFLQQKMSYVALMAIFIIFLII